MKIEQLTILKYIVEYGSLKEAALQLHKTQPALSIAIKKLEAEFGFQILDRSQYRLSLTPEGEIFYREVDILLTHTKQLSSLGKQLAQGNEAEFRICFEHICPQAWITPTIKLAYQAFPATEFHLNSGSRFTSLQEINDNKADIGIGPWFHLFHAQGEYESFCIGDFDLVIVATPSLVKGKNALSYKQLCQLPNLAIATSEFSFDSDKLSNYGGGRQLKVSDILSLKNLLLGSLGWAIVPRHIILHELNAKQLVTVTCSDKEDNFSGEIRVFRRADKVHGPVSEFIWNTLKEQQKN